MIYGMALGQVMALPLLSELLTSAPGYALDTSLGDIAQALGQAALPPSSYIVVIDDQRCPVGAIALGHLLGLCSSSGHMAPDESSLPERPPAHLRDCSPWLVPIVQVLATQTLAEVWALAQTSGQPPLVVVDDAGQYLGVVNPEAILAWLACQINVEAQGISLAPEVMALPPTAEIEAEAQNQDWVLEVSHALKTPMTSLLGLSTLLLDPRVGSLSDRQTHYVTLMHQAVRKLMELINQHLDWLRLEAGQLVLELESVELQEFAQNLLPSFLAQRTALDPPLDWPHRFKLALPNEALTAPVDPLRLQQSMHYIMEYWQQQGLEPGGLGLEQWGAWLGLTLWATETGEDPRPSPAELEPQSLKGLGLTLARRFSQLQGGDLAIWPALGTGPRITLLIPSVSPETEPLTTALVMLACDSLPLIEQVYGCLQGSRYRLVLARSAEELLGLWSRLSPAYVVLDADLLSTALGPLQTTLLATGSLSLTQVLRLEAAPTQATDGAVTLVARDNISSQLLVALDQLWPFLETSLVQSAGEITLLLLYLPSASRDRVSTSLRDWLQHYRCRLLQVDDLEQASLLSRVWQPNAVVLDGALTTDFLHALTQCPDLLKYRLITLTSPNPALATAATNLGIVVCSQVLEQPPHQGALTLLRAMAVDSEPTGPQP